MNPGKSVFVIDDDPIYILLLRRQLEKIGAFASIAAFQDAYEAMEAIRAALPTQEGLPDVILLDVNMPGMDGWDFLDEFAGLESEIAHPIGIYVCSFAETEAERARASTYASVMGYVQKPIPQDVVNLIAASASYF
jgi:CheY-like chemotaxis protein